MTPRPLQSGSPPVSPTRSWRLGASPVEPVAAFWGALALAAINATVSAATHTETHENPMTRLGLWLGANAVAVVLRKPPDLGRLAVLLDVEPVRR